MNQPDSLNRAGRSWPGSLAAVLIGLIGAVAIWVAVPYNNFLLGNSFIADDYLPAAVLFLILVLVLGINPLLGLVHRGLVLAPRQLAIILAIMLLACVVPSQGLLRMLPYMIARAPADVSQSKQLAEQYERMDLPPGLFPDKLALRSKPTVCEQFLEELPKGERIPWAAWGRPLLTWGPFVLFSWLMMIGLSLIVLPQWRRNERLAFPLLTVEQSLIRTSSEENPADRPVLRQRWFWVAAGIVFLLHFLKAVNIYFPESVPEVPLKWDLGQLMSTDPWRYIPGHIRASQIYFTFLGVAFFMPNRIGFSIWFTILAYGIYRMIAQAYLPPYYHGALADHRTGAMVALTVAILWIGRAHWAAVLASLLRRGGSDEDRRNRRSGWMLLVGCTGLFAWLAWVGVSPVWALLLVGFAFIVALLVSRIVAETGMPFWRIHGDATFLMKLAPLSWIQPVALYFSAVVTTLFAMGSRVSPATMATHGLALDESISAKRQWHLGLMFIGVLAAGMLLSGAVHLNISYHYSGTLGPAREQPISSWGTERLRPAQNAVLELSRGELGRPPQNVPAHILFGAALAGVLYWLCLAFPTWPLHPVGLLLISTPSYGDKAWVSICVGWLIKVVLVRFGGAIAYRRARSLFLGVIMGEVLAAVFWSAMPAVLVGLGRDYRVVDILPR